MDASTGEAIKREKPNFSRVKRSNYKSNLITPYGLGAGFIMETAYCQGELFHIDVLI